MKIRRAAKSDYTVDSIKKRLEEEEGSPKHELDPSRAEEAQAPWSSKDK